MPTHTDHEVWQPGPCNDALMSERVIPGTRRDRVVVGSSGDDTSARLMARALLMSGREVVFVGGGQSADQLARTVEAEDAGSLVLDGDDDERAAAAAALAALGLDAVQVRGRGAGSRM